LLGVRNLNTTNDVIINVRIFTRIHGAITVVYANEQVPDKLTCRLLGGLLSC